MKSFEIRKSFIDFFVKKDHTFVPSASVVPAQDPTIMFTNAGMNQFKDLFLGLGSRSYKRACNSQKCIRVSGKHNDLEEVGLDTYHHTFFEMLGNWSFGDYYKKEAILWAWELLTKVWHLPQEKLYVTVYKDDAEAEKLWKEITSVKPAQVLRFAEKDNFWEMGETGPCGPCSEIHIDMGPDACDKKHLPNHQCAVNGDCARFIEIWNLVFIQFNRTSDGSLEELKSKHIDTGMGFERISAILQNKISNYETDIFQPIIQETEKISGGNYKSDPVPFRVIADHIRTLSFAIADGVIPANEGRGYILRRILRRASRFGKKLGLEKPFLKDLCSIVVREMGEFYPELIEKKKYIYEVLKSEEESFLVTLDQGIQKFESLVSRNDIAAERSIPGAEAFKLYDTYGFPPDLTSLMAREIGFSVDMAGFNKALEEQRERARSSVKGGDLLSGKLEKNKQILPSTIFSGYEKITAQGKVVAIFEDSPKNEILSSINHTGAGKIYWLVTDESPCYGESGGQMGDKGALYFKDALYAELTDTQKREDRIFHRIKVSDGAQGELKLGDMVTWFVDEKYRRGLMVHHSATHALQHALRKVLGDHVGQAGSIVYTDRLRFDFTHFKALSDAEIEKIEDIVNTLIEDSLELHTSVTSLAEAKKQGAMAFFGDKYGESVRVVKFGESVELCGGTHVANTLQMQVFKIIKESSPGAGIRRIEALAGSAASTFLRNNSKILNNISKLLQSTQEDTPEAVRQLMEKNKELRRGKSTNLSSTASDSQKIDFDTLLEKAEKISNYNVLSYEFPAGTEISTLRDFADRYRQKEKAGICLFGARQDEKAILIFAAAKGLTPKPIDCNILMKAASPFIEGGGGGRPDMVQAGGKNILGLKEALQAGRRKIQEL